MDESEVRLGAYGASRSGPGRSLDMVVELLREGDTRWPVVVTYQVRRGRARPRSAQLVMLAGQTWTCLRAEGSARADDDLVVTLTQVSHGRLGLLRQAALRPADRAGDWDLDSGFGGLPARRRLIAQHPCGQRRGRHARPAPLRQPWQRTSLKRRNCILLALSRCDTTLAHCPWAVTRNCWRCRLPPPHGGQGRCPCSSTAAWPPAECGKIAQREIAHAG